jgi:hypothetical protein
MSILSEFTNDELEEVISSNPNLRGYLQGYLAEVALKKQLLEIEGVSEVIKIPDHDEERGDLRVTYKGLPLTIEVKSIKTDSVRKDVLHDTWQGTVTIKSSDKREVEVEGLGLINSSHLIRGQFDILAISCYAVSGQWEFVFMDNDHLPPKSYKTPELIKTSFVVNPQTTPCLITDMQSILEGTYEKKKAFVKI